MPKSSSASLKPHALSSASTFWVRSGSAIAVDSVISTVTSLGSTPAPRTDAIVFSDRCADQSWRGDRLNPTGAPGPRRAQAACWRPSSPITQSPIASISPSSSASGMNSPGGDDPAGRVRPADQALDRRRSGPSARLDDRLPVQHPGLLLHGLAEPGGERQPLHRVLAARREDRVAARLVALRLVHRVVGVLQQRRRVGGVLREEADPDRAGRVELPSRPGRRAAPSPRGRGRRRLRPRRPRGRARRRPTRRARGPTSRIRNSSPPWRATRSVSRMLSRSRSASWASSRSPAWCPSESFTSLKLSRSRNTTPTPVSLRRARAIAWSSISSNRCRFGRPSACRGKRGTRPAPRPACAS